MSQQIHPCPYCRGTGKDRFRVMSALSSCPACHGKKCHHLTLPLVKCAHCGGSGVSPTGTRNPCLACRGKGVHHRSPKAPKCPHCLGSGTAPGNLGFYCIPCHGSGVQFTP
ncbi:hypothetical protein [[Phormidium] sp. ETS-05]|uniref:hypothetical protein n=1 Tax=[Phormidium] sp. ETS-05 TaxID=222819 RepID=UPI0018EED77C|nr:hypothetical protein [[Phormidium] sp. ETS-05]